MIKKIGAAAILLPIILGLAGFLSTQVFSHSSRIRSVETRQEEINKRIDREYELIKEIRNDVKYLIRRDHGRN